jgi:hypothetical protein
MRGTLLIISRCPIPVQLEQKRPCEGLRGEHAIFDRCPCCAAIRCGDDDSTVPHDIVARYGFAIDILNADFFTHRSDPCWGRFISSGSFAMLAVIRRSPLDARSVCSLNRRQDVRLHIPSNLSRLSPGPSAGVFVAAGIQAGIVPTDAFPSTPFMPAAQKPNLLSARSKVERANHHIRDIERWLRAYRDRNAHSVQIGTDAGEDSDGSGVRITNPAVQLPAEDLPCAVGDAVHNLRSALDHIAAAIYLAAGVNPEEATFPIDTDRKSLVRKRKYQEIERLAPGLAKIISDYECMNGVGDRLIAMNHLDRADKHRLLIVIAVVAETKVLTINDENSPDDFPADTVLVLPGNKAPAVASRAGRHNERSTKASVDIRFGKGEPFQDQSVIPTLHQLAQLVDKLIDTLS